MSCFIVNLIDSNSTFQGWKLFAWTPRKAIQEWRHTSNFWHLATLTKPNRTLPILTLKKTSWCCHIRLARQDCQRVSNWLTKMWLETFAKQFTPKGSISCLFQLVRIYTNYTVQFLLLETNSTLNQTSKGFFLLKCIQSVLSFIPEITFNNFMLLHKIRSLLSTKSPTYFCETANWQSITHMITKHLN